MHRTAILVVEKSPRWESELKRQFLGDPVEVRACRSTRDVDRQIDRQPGGGVIVLDLGSGEAEMLQFLRRRSQQWPGWPALVVADREATELEWAVRELGALDFLVDPVPAERLAEACRRGLPNERETT